MEEVSWPYMNVGNVVEANIVRHEAEFLLFRHPPAWVGLGRLDETETAANRGDRGCGRRRQEDGRGHEGNDSDWDMHYGSI